MSGDVMVILYGETCMERDNMHDVPVNIMVTGKRRLSSFSVFILHNFDNEQSSSIVLPARDYKCAS